jgi:simple sugar transport system permease protein
MEEAFKSPLIRLEKRSGSSIKPVYAWLIRLGSIVFALLLGCIVIALAGSNPIQAYGTMLDGAVGNAAFRQQTIKKAVPLLGCALAIAPCFKMRFWNIGAEGQITAGALAATFVVRMLGPQFSGDSASLPLLLLMALAAMLLGGLWALIPGFFKAKWNTNETLFTLMMNYIIIGVVAWLQAGPWEARQGRIAQFPKLAWLPKVEGVHCGWIIVLVLVFLVHVYMRHTKQGYEIAVIGDSMRTAQYAGMNVGRIMMHTMFLSGAISGLVGFILCSGATNTLSKDIAGGVGFTSITVAWLSQLNAFAMVAISLMLGILTKGADTLQTVMNVPASISDIIIGLLLFCMLGCEFFINYRLILRKKLGKGGAVT